MIPGSSRAEVMKEVYDGVTGGYMGVARTISKLRERYYWVNCQAKVKDWCKKCATCAGSNGPQRQPKAPMRQYNVGSPFERIAIDVAGPFPESNQGNKYIVAVMDYFSKWAEAYALPNHGCISANKRMDLSFWCSIGAALRPREEL